MEKKIKIHKQKSIKSVSIKRTLLQINMTIAILPVLIFAIFITRVYSDTVDKRTRKSVEDSSTVIADRITRVLKDSENCANYMVVNINKVMEKQEAGKKLTLTRQKAITNELYVAKIVFDEIDSIAFVSVRDEVLVSDNTILTNTEKILESHQYKRLHKTSGGSIWFPCETRDFLVQDKTTPVLTLGKKVVQINTGKTLGYIFVNVNIDAIENIMVNQLINYRLIDEENIVISSVLSSNYIKENDAEKLIHESNDNRIKKYHGRKYYISSYEIADYGWRLIGITDLDEFNVDANKIMYMILYIAIGAIFFEMLLSNYLSRIITVPLSKLKGGAEEIAGGNLDFRFYFKTEDEIGQLGGSFNYMAEQVKDLLRKVDYEARKKQEYELSLLHEQVKPHFLYNSLDIIIKLSEMNRDKEARRAVRRLADYYRNSLSDSKKIITIGQEIKIVEDYLELQRIRYQDLFIYEVDIAPEIEEQLIPKLTLQPLIENAIYHGLKYKEKQGVLRITGSMSEKCVIVTVSDNGAGMNKEEIDILQNNPEGHFGIFSVDHRIKLFFGEQYGLFVNTCIGEGTIVTVKLPFTEIMGDK